MFLGAVAGITRDVRSCVLCETVAIFHGLCVRRRGDVYKAVAVSAVQVGGLVVLWRHCVVCGMVLWMVLLLRDGERHRISAV